MRGMIFALAMMIVAAPGLAPAQDLKREVDSLKKTIQSLQRTIDAQERKITGFAAETRRIGTLETKQKQIEQKTSGLGPGGKFNKSQIPLEAKVAQLTSQVQLLGQKVNQLEQKVNAATASGGGPSLTQIDNRLKKLEGAISVSGPNVTITAAKVTVNSGMSKFTGVVDSNALITKSVVSPQYTPGAGNVW